MTWGLKPTENNARYSSDLHPTPFHIHDRVLMAGTRADSGKKRRSVKRERHGKFKGSITTVLYACSSLSYVGFRINSITGNWGKFFH
jgi:hypothetical protein